MNGTQVLPRAARTSATRAVVLLAAAVVLALVHVPGRPATFCMLRGTVGVPCPFCGGTTAAVNLGRADLVGALRASPLVVLGALAWVVAPVRSLRRPSPQVLWVSVVAVALAAELWQLQRFGLV